MKMKFSRNPKNWNSFLTNISFVSIESFQILLLAMDCSVLTLQFNFGWQKQRNFLWRSLVFWWKDCKNTYHWHVLIREKRALRCFYHRFHGFYSILCICCDGFCDLLPKFSKPRNAISICVYIVHVYKMKWNATKIVDAIAINGNLDMMISFTLCG